jgi:hypothetical protein
MHDNDVPTEPAEARWQPVDHAYGASREWLADRFEQLGRVHAQWRIGCLATKAATSNTVRWFAGSRAGYQSRWTSGGGTSGVSTLRAPWQDRLS